MNATRMAAGLTIALIIGSFTFSTYAGGDRKRCGAMLRATHGQKSSIRSNFVPKEKTDASEESSVDLSNSNKVEKLRTRILIKFAKLARATSVFPPLADVAAEVGISEADILKIFGTYAEIRDAAKQRTPRSFTYVVDTERFNDKTFSQIERALTKYQRFVITTAVGGAPVAEGFYASLKHYCERNDAALLIKAAGNQIEFVAEELKDEPFFVFRELNLASGLFISDLLVTAKMIYPNRGAERLAGDRSMILAAPKQFLKFLAVEDPANPRAIMTTGAITQPAYQGEHYVQFRTDRFADHDHVIGAIVVETRKEGGFFFRQLQADEDGSFVDLGRQYGPDGKVTDLDPEVLVLGDWHSGATDPAIRDQLEPMCCALKPKALVIHDIFDGASINHYDKDNPLKLAEMAKQGKLDLEKELSGVADELEHLVAQAEEVIIVKSNHDEWLENWLRKFDFKNDPHNIPIALELASQQVNGEDPLRYGAHKFWKGSAKDWQRIRWLKRDEPFRVAGIQLGSHGDVGANGGKPSFRSLEQGHVRYVVGHTHSPNIIREGWTVGTSSILRPEYSRGLSSWAHAHVLVYPNGKRQMIMISQDGKWRLEKKEKAKKE